MLNRGAQLATIEDMVFGNRIGWLATRKMGSLVLTLVLAGAEARARPAAPMFSRDGAVTVRSQVEQNGYRAPILVFVDRTREGLQRTVRMKLGSANAPLEIVVGGQRDGDTRVVASQVRGMDGKMRERIELPDPEAADLVQFKRAICVALLRGWMSEAGGPQGVPREMPAWLIGGLMRYMERETRLADLDRTLLLWSHACLPPASELVAFDCWASLREPAVAATMLAWLLERRASGNAFEMLLRGLATGSDWRADRVALAVVGNSDEAAFDEALDLWLLSEGRQVVQVGVTSDGVVRRFRANLLLYPSDCDKEWKSGRPWVSFEEAIALVADPAIRRWAVDKANAVRLAAVGHDGMLLAVCDAYAHFLESCARGEKRDVLLRLLQEAEAKRSELERKTARGEVLRDAVAN